MIQKVVPRRDAAKRVTALAIRVAQAADAQAAFDGGARGVRQGRHPDRDGLVGPLASHAHCLPLVDSGQNPRSAQRFGFLLGENLP